MEYDLVWDGECMRAVAAKLVYRLALAGNAVDLGYFAPGVGGGQWSGIIRCGEDGTWPRHSIDFVERFQEVVP